MREQTNQSSRATHRQLRVAVERDHEADVLQSGCRADVAGVAGLRVAAKQTIEFQSHRATIPACVVKGTAKVREYNVKMGIKCRKIWGDYNSIRVAFTCFP